jgi:Tfp pilus assembly protein PilN
MVALRALSLRVRRCPGLFDMDVLGVQIRTDALAVARVRSSIFAVKAQSYDLIRGETLKDRVDGLRSYISGNAIENPRIALVLPRGVTISSVIEVPAPDASALGGILKFELEKHIPFKPDDAYWGFETVGRKDKVFSVLFAAVRKNTVDKIVEEFSAAGLVLDSVGFWQGCLINALAQWKSPARGGNRAFIGISDGEVTLDVFSDLVPVYSKSVSAVRLGEEAWTGAVKRELAAFLRSSGTASPVKIDECSVISDEEPEGASVAELSKDLNLPVGSLSLNGLGLPSSAALALGASISALGKGRINIDLFAPLGSKKVNSGYLQTLALAFAVAVLLLLTGATYLIKDWFTLRRMESAVAEARVEKEKVDGLADSLKSAGERVKVLEGVQGANSPGALDVLHDLTVTLPQDTWLTDFEYNDGVVLIEGFSESASTQILTLERSGRMKDVEFAGPVTKGRGGKEHFRIKFKVRGHDEIIEAGKGGR